MKRLIILLFFASCAENKVATATLPSVAVAKDTVVSTFFQRKAPAPTPESYIIYQTFGWENITNNDLQK